MTAFTSAEIAALEAGAPRRGLFMRLETAPVIRAWLGVGKIEPGVNVLDTVGASYLGFGELLDMPAFQTFCDGSAERLAFSIPGIPPTLFATVAPLMSEQQVEVAGKPISVGYALLDYDWQPLGAIRWTWDGTAGVLRATKPVIEDAESPESWTIQLSAGSTFTGRRRPSRSYFTQQDQGPRSLVLSPAEPEDQFCNRTVLYTRDTKKKWPSFPS